MTSSDVLIAAARLIERGWCQGTYALDYDSRACRLDSSSARKWCVTAAIARVALKQPSLDFAARKMLTDAIGLTDAIELASGSSIVAWNDDPARTKEEVIAALLKAADRGRE